MSSVDDAINRFPEDIREPMHGFYVALRKELGEISKGFAETHTKLDRVDATLDRVFEGLERLEQAQERTEASVARLSEGQEKLFAAQARTDESLRELSAAQARTDATVAKLSDGLERLEQAQQRTEASVARLSEGQDRLFAAQARTGQGLEDLAKAQAEFGRNFDFKIGGLGDRWGMMAEGAFRSGSEELLAEAGFAVERFDRQDTEGVVFGHRERVELDVVVTNGTTILVEIKSSVDFTDVYYFKRKSEFYDAVCERPADKLVVVAPHVTERALAVAARLGVVVCTSPNEMRNLA